MPSANDPPDTPAADEPSYVTTFDPDAGERASDAVVTAVAALLDENANELTPLYEAVEPDALDALVDHAHRGGGATHELWFTYEGFDVGVRSDGEIRIREASMVPNADLE